VDLVQHGVRLQVELEVRGGRCLGSQAVPFGPTLPEPHEPKEQEPPFFVITWSHQATFRGCAGTSLLKTAHRRS
jgi:hypothetical protein